MNGMKVVWIDPEQRALYVMEGSTGGYFAVMQRGQQAPRTIIGTKTEFGYATFEEAQEALSLHISQKKQKDTTARWGKWEIFVNGKSVSEDDYHKMCRKELAVPIELPPNAQVSLANIEYRIALHIQGAYENVLEVGRCLNEAKDSGLVPHGEWEGWIRRNTDMTERQAQRLMQVARSVNAGSMMERLPITKIQALLALPEPEREPMAKKAVDEGLSVRELQKEVELYRNKARIAETEAEKIKQDKAWAYTAAQANAQREIQDLTSRIKDLEGAQIIADHVDHADIGISPEAQAKIDRLQAQLAEKEAFAERQAELRAQAQRELLDAQTQAVRGEAPREHRELTAYDLADAVRAFMGVAGVLPHMGVALEQLSGPEKEAFRQQVDIISRWTDGSEQALNVICAVVSIE